MRTFKEFVLVAEQQAFLGFTKKLGSGFGSGNVGANTSVSGGGNQGSPTWNVKTNVERGEFSDQGGRISQGIDTALKNLQTGSNSNTSTSNIKKGITGSINANISGGSRPTPSTPKPEPKPVAKPVAKPTFKPTQIRSVNPHQQSMYDRDPKLFSYMTKQVLSNPKAQGGYQYKNEKGNWQDFNPAQAQAHRDQFKLSQYGIPNASTSLHPNDVQYRKDMMARVASGELESQPSWRGGVGSKAALDAYKAWKSGLNQ